MGLREKLDADLKAAMKERDALKVSVVRLLKSAIKYREIEVMSSFDVAGIRGVVATEVKRRRDPVEQYQAGGRRDLADQEAAEMASLQAYLPQQLSQAELAATVQS